LAWTLASNRERAVARTDSLTTDAHPARDERRDPDERVAAEGGDPRSSIDVAASTMCGATLTLATRSPSSTT
jgi:hypothetical protein